MDGKKLRVGFLSQHRALVRRLDTESLLPALVGEGLLSHDENTAIRHEVTGSQKSDSLLTVIHRLGFANPAVYVSFLKLLSDRFITAGQQLESLVQAINDDSVDEAIAKKFSNATDVLEENHNASLQAHKQTIVGSINVYEILPFLISEGVVTILEKEDINAKATVTERAELLLRVIRARGSPAFLVFVRVLASLESYEHLARLLESPEAGGSGDDDEKIWGSPMAIGLIGAILRKNNREAKWKAVAQRLERKHSVSSMELHAAVNDWNYQHPTLNASMELSVESLPQNMKQYFELFVVFDHDTLISGDALETIWALDSLDTEDMMMELVGYSLAQQANPGAENPDYLLYFIHDIVLDYLADTVPTHKQVAFHKQVVARYTDKCNGAFPQLPDDSYLYQKLLGHIAAAGQ